MKIPSGLVAFLFTDIEGSTMLAQKNPDRYNECLSRHNNILSELISFYNGYIFKTVGDSFCSSFQNADSAVIAAIQIQKNIDSKFTDGIPLRIRIGIHMGHAEYSNGDYIGYVTLSKAQRLMSIAYGGQILITKVIFDRILNNKEEFLIRDFGLRKLKNINQPEHVYQIYTKDLQSEFPPLKTADARQNNLPEFLSNFIGREKESEDISEIISLSRLLTLIGPGGTGKTRLAIKCASGLIDEFENGIWLTELSPITNPDFIINEICYEIGLKETSGSEMSDNLKNFLKDKNTLLILDNCEHLLSHCSSIVEDLLKYCPGLKIICTSRETLNIQGEYVYFVHPLKVPGDLNGETFESISEYESVKLFIDRAISVKPGFTLNEQNIMAVAELCKRIDGIPLAVELAAKRIIILSVEKINEKLSDRFRFLTGGNQTALPRHKTLRALIDWSYELLNEKEKLMLQRLSVFSGGWTLEAAEQVCCSDGIDDNEVLDLIISLHNKSLLYRTDNNESVRYGMLDTIRIYSYEKLNDKLKIFKNKIKYFVSLSDYHYHIKMGMQHFEWLKSLKAEIDNIRSSIQNGIELALNELTDLVLNMSVYWNFKGTFSEGVETLQSIINSDLCFDELIAAKLKARCSYLCYSAGNFKLLETYAKESIQVLEKSNDKAGLIESFKALALKAFLENNEPESLKLFEKAIMLCGNMFPLKKAELLLDFSMIYAVDDTMNKSLEMKKEALRIFREEKNQSGEAFALLNISVNLSRYLDFGDKKEAYRISEQSLAISNKLEDNYLISLNLIHLGSLKLTYEKDYNNAEYLLLDGLKISMDSGYDANLFPTLIFLGFLYIQTKQPEKAQTQLKEYINRRGKSGSEFFIKDIFFIGGMVFMMKNKLQESAVMFGLVEKLSQDKKFKTLLPVNIDFKNEISELKKELGDDNYKILTDKEMSLHLENAVAILLSGLE